MSAYIGTVHRLSGGLTVGETHLFIYNDALVIAPGEVLSSMAGLAVGGVFGGLIGQKIGRNATTSRAETMGSEELAARSRRSRLIPLAPVTSARLEKGFNGRRSLVLHRGNGMTETIKWQKSVNKDRDVVPLLQAAFGSKLAAVE